MHPTVRPLGGAGGNGAPEVDPAEPCFHRPNLARIHDYWTGGKNHFECDRDLADELTAILPDLPTTAQVTRIFLAKAVRRLVRGFGIRQLIEVGAGFPGAYNAHEVAQSIVPAARVVHVVADPLLAAHGRALLPSHPDGRVQIVQADAAHRQPFLTESAETLDLRRPVAVLVAPTLAHLPDAVAHHLVRTLLDTLPAGSFVVVSNLSADWAPDAVKAMVDAAAGAGIDYHPRSRDEIADLLAELDLVDPGIVPLLDWEPDLYLRRIEPHELHSWVGMARKPQDPRP